MSKKNLKLIMELIFIFILPLVFICFTSEIQVEREFAYDNNGNYETTQETKNLSFDNSIIKYENTPRYINYLNYNQLILSNYTDKDFSEVNDNFFGITDNLIANDYYYIVFSDTSYVENGYQFYSGSTYRLTTGIYQLTNGIQYARYNNIDYNGKINLINLTQMFGNDYIPTLTEIQSIIDYYTYEYIESEIIEYKDNNIIAEEHRINYTIWGNIKELLINNLDLNDNVLLDIVLCYTILWMIMFLIWHLLYGMFELIVHIIPRKE